MVWPTLGSRTAKEQEQEPASYAMRAHSVTTNERARWPTPRAMNMYDIRHLAPSTGRRTNEGIQPAAQLIVSSVGIGQLYSLICIRDVVKRRKPEVFLKTLFVWK